MLHRLREKDCWEHRTALLQWFNVMLYTTTCSFSSFSSPVKPNPPEKVTVNIMQDQGWPFLRISWEPPHKADTRSGWITLIYELRVKLEGEDDWEVRGSLLLFVVSNVKPEFTVSVSVNDLETK